MATAVTPQLRNQSGACELHRWVQGLLRESWVDHDQVFWYGAEDYSEYEDKESGL